MSRLVQIAQRSTKAPVGFKLQLVVHRMNGNLGLKHDTELVAMILGRKKKLPTKPGLYHPVDEGSLRRWHGSRALQSSPSRTTGETGEVVWGDMVAFSSTLYLSKSGLFQAKRFQIHVSPFGEEAKPVAVFEFDLAELVPVLKDAGKESVRLNATKCPDDPRASISITIISSRVTRGVESSNPKERSCADDNTSDFGSELSAYTSYSRASSLVSTCRRHPEGSPLDNGGEGGKTDALRVAGHPVAVEEGERGHDQAHDELMQALEHLELQLRESEAANVKFERLMEQKEREIERLTRLAAGLKADTRSEEVEKEGMQVDLLVYLTLKEELEALKVEHELCQTPEKKRGMYTITDVENEEEHGIVEVEEPPETKKLKEVILTQRREIDELKATIQTLTLSNNEMAHQVEELQAIIEQKEAAYEHSTTALRRVESEKNEVDNEEAPGDALETALSDNKRLERQLLQFDGAMTVLEAEKSRLVVQLREAERARAVAQDEIVHVQEALKELVEKSHGLSSKLEEVEQAREQAEEHVGTAEATVRTLHQQVQDISTQLHKTQQELEDLRDQQRLASSLALEEMIAKHQTLARQWEEAKTESERLQARVEALEVELAQSEASGATTCLALQAQVDQVQREADALRHELEALRESTSAREVQVQEMRTRLESLSDQRLSLELMTREELLTRLQEHVKMTTKATEELTSKVGTLEDELNYFQRELIESKMQVAQLTQTNDELQLRNRQLQRTIK